MYTFVTCMPEDACQLLLNPGAGIEVA